MKQRIATRFFCAALCLLAFCLSACAQASENELIRETETGPGSEILLEPVLSAPTAQESGKIAYVLNTVGVRQEPAKEAEILGMLHKGDSVIRLFEGADGWDGVLYQGKRAFLSHDHLTERFELTRLEPPAAEAETDYLCASPDAKGNYPDGWIEEFNRKIIALQRNYPDKSYWNRYGEGETSDTPCRHEWNGETYCNKNMVSTALFLGFEYGTQCTGFSGMLSDEIFGADAPIRSFTDYEKLRIGDQARINEDSHTVFILDKTDEYVIVAECNADYQTCRIDWGRKIPRYRLRGQYLTRWDETDK